MNRKQLSIALFIFAILNLFATGKWSIAPVAWLMPAVGLYIIHRTSARRGFFLLYLAASIPMMIAWYGAAAFPMPFYPFFMLFNIFISILPFLLDRVLAPRLGTGFLTTLVYPLAATAVEFIIMSGGPLGSFGAQAYTQADILPLTQLTAVTGLWGITFLIAWFASVANWAITRRQAGQPFVKGVAVYAVILVAVFFLGGLRLLTSPAAEDTVRVASFTAVHNDMGELMSLAHTDPDAFRQKTRANHAAYLAQTETAVATGAEIILWPELAGIGFAEDVDALVAEGQALAKAHNIYLAMPLFVLYPDDETQAVNKMVIADPNGDIVLDHVKYGGNMLEGTKPGSGELQVVETPFGKLTAVICWDTDFPGIVRQAGQQGVNLILSPAYVWPEVAGIHADMAPFRSIENGLSLVRHSDGGYTLVSDNYGRVLVKENHSGQIGSVMVAEVPIQSTTTIYPEVGDILGLTAVLGLLFVVGLVIFKRIRRPNEEAVLEAA